MALGPTINQSQRIPRADARRAAEGETAKRRVGRLATKANAAPDAVFGLTLLIVHPDIDTEHITNELGLKPYRSMTKGRPRTGISGTPLGGSYTDSRWNHCEHHAASHIASVAINDMLQRLQPHATFLKQLRATGADISLSLALPASHRGESIDVETVRSAADLGIGIGFEIFPEWDGEPKPGDVRGKR